MDFIAILIIIIATIIEIIIYYINDAFISAEFFILYYLALFYPFINVVIFFMPF